MGELEQALTKYRGYLDTLEESPELFELALEVIGNPDSALKWFLTSQSSLNGKLPLECTCDEVKNTLSAIEHGVYI